MSKQAMKLALEALDHNLLFTSLMPGYDGRVIEKAYKAINKVLAEQPTDWEAVAADQAMTIGLLKSELQEFAERQADAVEVALTEGEIQKLLSQNRFAVFALVRAIEAAHGIKENT